MGKVKVPSNDVKKDRVKNSTIRYKKRRGFGNKKNVVPVVKDPAVDAVPEADIVVEDEHVDVVVSSIETFITVLSFTMKTFF